MKILYVLAFYLLLAGKCTAQNYAEQIKADTSSHNLIEITFHCDQDSIYCCYGDLPPTIFISRIIKYKIPAGEYTFKFLKRGFEAVIEKINISAPQTLSIDLKRSKGDLSSKLNLSGIINVTSEPSNASVYINGQMVGETPYRGKVATGVNQLEIRKPSYNSENSVILVEEKKTEAIWVKLKPKFGFLSVSSPISGSKVYIDGKFIGETPLDNLEVECARHTIIIEANMYRDYQEEFEINSGENKSINAELKPAFGMLGVTSLPESSADVYLNGKKVGITPYKNTKLPSGKYTLKVAKPYFNTTEEELIITDGSEINREITLNTDKGMLTISAPECNIVLNGEFKGKSEYHAILEPGNYSIKISRDQNFYPIVEDVIIKPGEKKLLTYAPKPRLGSLSIFVKPIEASSAEIYLDDQLKGNAPLVFPVIIGGHLVKVKKPDFEEQSLSCLITEKNTTTLKFSLTKFQESAMSATNIWGTVKWVGFGTAALSGATAAYFKISADKNYWYYRSATAPNDIARFKNKVESHNSIYRTALFTGIAALGSALISWMIQ